MIIWSDDHRTLWPYHHMMIWSYDHMVIRSYDDMTIWSHDRIIIWSYDHMIIWPYDHIIMWSSNNQKTLGFRVERWNVGDRLKRVFAKFQANRSHPRGTALQSLWRFLKKLRFHHGKTMCGTEKKWRTKNFRRRKMKCRESPETCFPKFWGRSEPCLKGKRPFKVSLWRVCAIVSGCVCNSFGWGLQ